MTYMTFMTFMTHKHTPPPHKHYQKLTNVQEPKYINLNLNTEPEDEAPARGKLRARLACRRDRHGAGTDGCSWVNWDRSGLGFLGGGIRPGEVCFILGVYRSGASWSMWLRS